MKRLRLELRLSCTAFAALLGMGVYVMQSREGERVPWQPGEVAHARRKIAAHLDAGTKALATLDA